MFGAAQVALFGTIRLWVRPLAGVTGYLGDKISVLVMLKIIFVLMAISFISLYFISNNSIGVIVFWAVGMFLISFSVYSVRGLYWSILEKIDIPMGVTGSAIGFISLIGYAPEMILPQINVYLLNNYSNGHQIYYMFLAVVSITGFILTFIFSKFSKKEDKAVK